MIDQEPSRKEVEASRAHPRAVDAIALRRCHDTGRDTTHAVPDSERFHTRPKRVVAQR